MGNANSSAKALKCTTVNDRNADFVDTETGNVLYCTVISLRSVFGGVVTHAVALLDWTIEAGAWGGYANTQIVDDRDWWMLPASRTSVTLPQVKAWTKRVTAKGWVGANGTLTALEKLGEIDLAIIASGQVLYTNGYTTQVSIAFSTAGKPYLFFKDKHLIKCAADPDEPSAGDIFWSSASFFATWPASSALAKTHSDTKLTLTPRLSVWTHAPATVGVFALACMVLVTTSVASYPVSGAMKTLSRLLYRHGLLQTAASASKTAAVAAT